MSDSYSDPFAHYSDDEDSPPHSTHSHSHSHSYDEYDDSAHASSSSPAPTASPATKYSRAAPPARPDPRLEYAFSVEVSDPVKKGKGVSQYVSYTVSTTSDLPGFSLDDPVVVSRRFRDFLWLHQTLRSSGGPGVIVPPLPEKVFIGRFQAHVIEYRQILLQQYLARVGTHPILRAEPVLRAFLQDIQVPSPKTVKDDVVSTLSNFDYHTLIPSYASLLPSRKNQHDGEYDIVLNDAQTRDTALRALADGAKVVVSATTDEGEGWGHLCSSALELTAEYEPNADLVEQSMAILADAASESCDRCDQMAELCDSYVSIPARRAIRQLREIKRAVDSRNELCAKWWSLEDKLAKREEGDEPEPGPESQSTIILRDRVATAAAEFDAADARLKDDLNRVQDQRVEDAASALHRLVSMRVEAHKAAAQAWRSTLSELLSLDHQQP